MSRRSNGSAWRASIAPLRQEASAKGFVSRANLKAALEGLRAADADLQENELAEDLSFLVQQLLGPQASPGAAAGCDASRDCASARVALCRLLASLLTLRTLHLHAPAANLVLGALRQWTDTPADDAVTPPPAPASPRGAAGAAALGGAAGAAPNPCGSAQDTAPPAGAAAMVAAAGAATAAAGLQLEALAALSSLLPGHLGLLSEHERAAQLAALHSLVTPPHPARQQQQQQQQRAAEAGRATRNTDVLECQTLALTALAGCCGRAAALPGGAGGGGGGGGGAASTTSSTAGGGGSSSNSSSSPVLTADETGALLSSAVSLLQSCASRSRPVEDPAHSRMYAALVRAVQAAVAAAADIKQAWVPRAGLIVEGLQRLLTYGVQASLAAVAGGAGGAGGAGSAASDAAGPQQPAAAGSGGGGGGGSRYRPPHLRRRESQADGGSGFSDSDVSDTEHAASGSGSGRATSGGTGGSAVPDRFRSSRVRLGALMCVQAMAASDPRVMQPHWTALLPLHSPLQPRPLTPHLLTVLLFDPFAKVRALAAATIAALFDGPAPRAVLAVAEAKSMSARPPVRGFLTLSLSLGQLLLGAHAGLLHAVGHESSGLVLPGVLRALVVLVAASPYERLPPELLPETIKVLRTRWAALSASSAAASAAATAVPAGELAPIHAAYLACVAECFATKQPIPGLAAYLTQRNPPPHHPQTQSGQQHQADSTGGSEVSDHSRNGGGEQGSSGAGAGGGSSVADQLVQQLLAVGRDLGAPVGLRIEALAALKGLAAHYPFALPQGAWDDLRDTAELGLNSAPPPRSPRTPSRNSSSSSLSLSLPLPSVGTPGARAPLAAGGAARTGPPALASASNSNSATSTSPEDKVAQLSVKLVSEYLASAAKQYGIVRTDAAGGGDDDGGSGGAGAGPLPAAAGRPAPPPPGGLPAAGLGEGEDDPSQERERAAGAQRLAGMWREATALLVPAATGHLTHMVRSAGLVCLGEVPEPVFALLPPDLQHRLLGLLSDAAAGDTVPAVRAAACKSLGAAAAFPAVLSHAGLSDGVARALAGCLRDSVLSVRIAAGWAVANLCDAHRRRFAEAATATAAGEEDVALLQQRVESHGHASTTNAAAAAAASTATSPGSWRTGAGTSLPPPRPPQTLERHHYRQLALLCGAAVTATQDADKVRANGIRAVGNLLAFLTPDMAPGLAEGPAGPAGGSGSGGPGAGAAAANGTSSSSSSRREGQNGSWGPPGRWQGESASNKGGRSTSGASSWRTGPGDNKSAATAGGGGSGSGGAWARGGTHSSAGGGGAGTDSGADGGIQLDVWLDGALTCLQSSLTTGGMKVQWNACYAALGLLRNAPLLAHPRAASRVAPLLLLLVMLVRESANFKIRTHAAAALAALPTREAYGDVLPDALLVVAGALEALSSGGGGVGGGGGASVLAAPPAAKAGPAAGTEVAGGEGGEGEGADGRFPNYRYTAGLTAQLRATLVHLLALARPGDARRVRDALGRRAEFIHGCLREQLAEAVGPLRAAADGMALEQPSVWDRPAGSGGPGAGKGDWAAAAMGGGGAGRGAGPGGGGGGAALQLPRDPFGLSGRGGTSPRDASTPQGLAGLLAGLSLRGVCSDGDGRAAHGVQVGGSGGGGSGGAGEAAEVRAAAAARVVALVAPLRGFAALLSQVGPSGEEVLRDVEAALAAVVGGSGGR